jgi:hypothetical protein
MRTKQKTTIKEKSCIKISASSHGQTLVLVYEKKRLLSDYTHYCQVEEMREKKPLSLKEAIKHTLFEKFREMIGNGENHRYIKFH